MRNIIAMSSGLIFGLGLTLSRMIDPSVVLGFLDISGAWNPSLAFVLGGAVCVSILAWYLMGKIGNPIVYGTVPTYPASKIDGKLIGGSLIFGIGWGLVGICPGPAIVGVSMGSKSVVFFLVAMFAGMAVFERFKRLGAKKPLNNG